MEFSEFDIVKRIDKTLKVKKGSRKDLCLSLELAPNTLSNWEIRKTVPAADIAIRIAEYLGVSVYWLITGKDEQGLTLEDRNLLVKYHSLDDQGRYEIQGLLDIKLAVRVEEKAPDPGLEQAT
jgi:transcriptional regulator with XRE-family HTH domain